MPEPLAAHQIGEAAAGIEEASEQEPDESIICMLLDSPNEILIQHVLANQPAGPDHRRHHAFSDKVVVTIPYLKPGAYTLHLSIRDNQSGKLAATDLPFTVVPFASP